MVTSSWPHFFGPPCTHTHTENFSVGRSPGDFGCFPTASPTYRPHYYWTAPQRRRICNNSNRRMYANIDFPFDFAIFLLPLRNLTSLSAPTFCHFNGRKSLPPTLAFFAVFLSFPCAHSLPRKATPSYDIIYRTSAVCERCYRSLHSLRMHGSVTEACFMHFSVQIVCWLVTTGYSLEFNLYIGWSDVTESTVMIRSPFCGYNTLTWI